MGKENLISANVRGLSGRITRSQAVALPASGQLPPLSPSNHLDQKWVLEANAKRAASDHNNSSASDKECLKHKKKAALQVVTNVCCNCPNRSFFNATKIQPKNTKKAKKGLANVSKVAPSVAAEIQHPQPGIETKGVQETLQAVPKLQEHASHFGQLQHVAVVRMIVVLQIRVQECPCYPKPKVLQEKVKYLWIKGWDGLEPSPMRLSMREATAALPSLPLSSGYS